MIFQLSISEHNSCDVFLLPTSSSHNHLPSSLDFMIDIFNFVSWDISRKKAWNIEILKKKF
jgi:uncharacterized protein YjlB